MVTVRASEAGTVAINKSAMVSSSQVNSVNVWQYIDNITEMTFMRCISCGEEHGWLLREHLQQWLLACCCGLSQ